MRHDISRSHLKLRHLLMPLTLLLILSCAHKGTDKPVPGSDADKQRIWSEKMQSLSSTLQHLLPLVASPSKFSNLENQDRIEDDIKNLRRLAHSLDDKGVKKPNTDPTMAMVSGLFAEDIGRAADAMRAGNREYARAILRDTANYCVSCHTQNDNGPSFPKLTLDFQLKDLPSLDRAEFFAATRQFDAATDEFKKALESEAMSKADEYTWERAARSALAILIRVKKQPPEAEQFVQALINNSQAPAALKKEAQSWAKEIKSWKREKTAKKTTPAAVLAKAEAMVKEAKSAQHYPLDHREDVLWFRAGGLLHDLLGENPGDAAFNAKVLYLAGVTAEATRDMNFWTMHERFYELCIEKDPGSQQAKQCFGRLVDSITMGYSGSAGVQIPLEVQKKLAKYRGLANG